MAGECLREVQWRNCVTNADLEARKTTVLNVAGEYLQEEQWHNCVTNVDSGAKKMTV